MAWGTAASFEELYMRRIRPPKSSKAWNAFSRIGAPLWLPLRGSPEMKTQPMVPQVSTPVSRQRTERRIAVRLPLLVRGRDKRGVLFEEQTSSENLSRSAPPSAPRLHVSLPYT